MLYQDDGFIILKVNPNKKFLTRDTLLKISNKKELADALVRKDVIYSITSPINYAVFISDMKNNPFIRGHIKHVNLFRIYGVEHGGKTNA